MANMIFTFSLVSYLGLAEFGILENNGNEMVLCETVRTAAVAAVVEVHVQGFQRVKI